MLSATILPFPSSSSARECILHFMNTHLWGWACVFSGSACSASAWAHCVRTPRTDDWRHLVFFWFICLTSFSLLLSSAGLVADIQAGKSSLQFPASVCTLYLHGRETTLITTVSGHQLLSGYFYLKLTWPLDLYSWEKTQWNIMTVLCFLDVFLVREDLWYTWMLWSFRDTLPRTV